MKERAAGRPVVMLPLILFTDDTSGNKSKKWHKFDSWSVLLAGLPRHENSKISNIHLVCCSDVASALDMAGAVVADLTTLEDGIEAYDALLEETALILSPLLCILADNPRASELLNHLGGSARKCCRMCMVSLFPKEGYRLTHNKATSKGKGGLPMSKTHFHRVFIDDSHDNIKYWVLAINAV